MYHPMKRVNGAGAARVEREFQILTILYDTAGIQFTLDGQEEVVFRGMTSGEIAKKMRMANSPHLRGMLDEMFGRGELLVTTEPYHKNVQKIIWKVNPSVLHSEIWRDWFAAYLIPF